jgi:hypothetical protein
VNAIIIVSGLGVPLDPGKPAWDECEGNRTASLTSFDIRLMLSEKTARRGQGKAVGCAVPTALLSKRLPKSRIGNDRPGGKLPRPGRTWRQHAQQPACRFESPPERVTACFGAIRQSRRLSHTSTGGFAVSVTSSFIDGPGRREAATLGDHLRYRN